MIKQKRRTDSAGLTLIEVMLAVAVVGLGMLLLLGTFPSIHGTAGSSRDAARALYHGMTVLEEIRALPSSIFEQYIPPVMTELGTDEVITVTVVDNAGNEVALPADFGAIGPGVPDPVEVRVNIQWTDESGRPKTTTLSTKKLLLT